MRRVHAPLVPDLDDGVEEGRTWADLVLGDNSARHDLRAAALGLPPCVVPSDGSLPHHLRQGRLPQCAGASSSSSSGCCAMKASPSNVNCPVGFHLSVHFGLTQGPSVGICEHAHAQQ